MVPPWPPIVQYLEIILNLFFYVAVGWAWVSCLKRVSCSFSDKQVALGTFVANAVRVDTDPAKIQAGLAAAGGSTMKSVSTCDHTTCVT